MSEYTFKLPDLGEGMVESEIGEWFIKVGDQVAEEDVIATMMTDKAAVELSSPVSGTVIKLAGEPGDIVPVGGALMVLETDGAAAAEIAAEPAAAEEVAAEPAAAEAAPAKAAPTRVRTSPAIRHRAKEAGIDLAAIEGTGPGGRITRKDFENYAGAPSVAAEAAPATTTPVPETKEIKVIGLRRMIAERMATATREIPHFTYVEEIDITELESLRRHLNDKAPAASSRLTVLPFLGLALIRALREFPQ